MEIKSTQSALQAMMPTSHRLDSTERVSAFLAHSRLMVALYQAGRQIRPAPRRR